MGPKTAERAEFVVAALKEARGGIVTGAELKESLQMNNSNFYTFMMNLKKIYPYRIKSHNNPRSKEKHGYSWVFKKGELAQALSEPTFKETEPVVTDVEEVKEEPAYKYDEKKTEEGYSDPTAYLAMKRFEAAETGNQTAKRGDIWTINNSDGSSSMVTVLASNGTSITCIPSYYNKEDIHEKELPQTETVMVAGREVYVNVVRIGTKPFKYFREKVGEFSEDSFAVLKGYIGLYLNIMGLQTVEVPVEVEKIVEKEIRVEVPVEIVKIPEGYISEEECMRRIEEAVEKTVGTIPEDYISRKEAEVMANEKATAALIYQQAQIYKDFCEKLLKRAV